MIPSDEIDKIDGWNRTLDWVRTSRPTSGRLREEARILRRVTEGGPHFHFAKGGVEAIMAYIQHGVPPPNIPAGERYHVVPRWILPRLPDDGG